MKHATFSLPIPTSQARCERDVVFEDVMAFLGYSMQNDRDKGRTLRLLKGKTVSQIRRFISTAKQEGKNPPAYFQWLCRNF